METDWSPEQLLGLMDEPSFNGPYEFAPEFDRSTAADW